MFWFPDLPEYQNFVNRLNRLNAVFPVLVDCLLQELDTTGVDYGVTVLDSMPIAT